MAQGCSSGSAETAAESGDGGSYEERLQKTAGEFAYYERLNQNLATERWEKQGISLRVPKLFRPVETEPGNEKAISREVLGVELPGVLGAWEATLSDRDGTDPVSAWLFLMTNQHLLGFAPASASSFHQTLVEKTLIDLPGLDKLPIESQWKSENWTGHGLPFTSASFPADIAHTKQPATFTLYLMHYGENDRHDEIKAALLFVIPTSAELRGSRPDADPMRLSAETVRIKPQPGEKT